MPTRTTAPLVTGSRETTYGPRYDGSSVVVLAVEQRDREVITAPTHWRACGRLPSRRRQNVRLACERRSRILVVEAAASVQYDPSLQPTGELADGIGIEDVVLEGLAGPAQLAGHVGLLGQVLAGEAGDLLLELVELGGPNRLP